jgi:hypothetical protein
MKLIIVVNNATDTFETCILSRELASEEIVAIYELMGHGAERTVHIAECGDKAIPFLDIMEELKKIPHHEQPPIQHDAPGRIHNLQGLPTKYINEP